LPFRLTADTLKLVDAEAVPIVVVKAEGVSAVVIVDVTTLKVAEAPEAGAVFPAWSMAVPVAIEMPKVPAPVMPEMLTVYEVPDPDSPTVPLAVPVVFSVIFDKTRLLELKFASA